MPLRVPTVRRLLTMSAPLLVGVDALTFDGFSGYGEPFAGRVGPYDANSTAFLEVVESSNATGIFRFAGFDVSKPYPSGPLDGWTLHLAAVDLSQPKRSYSFSSDYPVEMIGHALSIKAPDSLIKDGAEPGTKIVDVDPSWGMCLWNFNHPTEREFFNNPENKPLSPDGSCKGLLSDACIAALEREASDSYAYSPVPSRNNATRLGSFVTCDSLSIPDECGEFGPGNAGSSVPSYSGVPIQFLNGSVTQSDGWLFEQDKGIWYNSSADLHEFWDSMVLNYWPMVTAFVNATIDPDADIYSQPNGNGKPQVLCVAPNGMGTGKAFTFNGTVPASSTTGDGSGGSGGGEDKKNGVVRGLTPSTGGLVVLLFAMSFIL